MKRIGKTYDMTPSWLRAGTVMSARQNRVTRMYAYSGSDYTKWRLVFPEGGDAASGSSRTLRILGADVSTSNKACMKLAHFSETARFI